MTPAFLVTVGAFGFRYLIPVRLIRRCPKRSLVRLTYTVRLPNGRRYPRGSETRVPTWALEPFPYPGDMVLKGRDTFVAYCPGPSIETMAKRGKRGSNV
jgi:hypothetical protein